MFAVSNDRLRTMPTHRLPDNAGTASEDTLDTHFPLPSAAHLLPRSSLRSQLCETLCGCACSFTSASKVCFICLKSLYTMGSHLSSTFFHDGKTIFSLRQHRTMGAAGFGGSFAPIVQHEKWEIHPVFPHFPYFRLGQNLSPNLLAPLCGAALILD